MTDAISSRRPVPAPRPALAYVRLAGDVERPRSFPVVALHDLGVGEPADSRWH